MDATAMLAALLNWAVMLSGYPTPGEPPRVEYKPHEYFVEHACGGRECSAAGWYNDAGIVYIDERLRDRSDTFTRSLLVHEFVHYLQHLSGAYDSHSCADQIKREHEAYAIQRSYVAEAHGEAYFHLMRPAHC